MTIIITITTIYHDVSVRLFSKTLGVQTPACVI